MGLYTEDKEIGFVNFTKNVSSLFWFSMGWFYRNSPGKELADPILAALQ